MITIQHWSELSTDSQAINDLETIVFPAYFNNCRWFAGKARAQNAFRFQHLLAISATAYLAIVEVSYHDGEPEIYQLPLTIASTETPEKGILCQTNAGLLIDALYDENFRKTLYSGIFHSTLNIEHSILDIEHSIAAANLFNNSKRNNSTLAFTRGKGIESSDAPEGISSRVLGVDSSNSALIFGEKYFFKLYRKLFVQTNPEVEMVRFLTQHSDFSHIPAFAGSFAWQRDGQPDVTLGMAQRMIQADKDNWVLTGDFLNDFLYGVPNGLFAVQEQVFEQVALLGRRTGEMHLALYAPTAEAAFAPEPFTDSYRQFLLKRLSDLLERRYALLIEKYATLDAPTQRLAWIFMEARELIDDFASGLLTRPLDSLRIRIHGDYHLGQVLTDQGDFIMIDFEGEPEASIADRKIKHSPLKDVAGMIRSYHYAVSAKLFESNETKNSSPEKLQVVSDRWYKLMRDTYLDAYLEVFGWPHPLFKSQNEINFLLLYYLLEKAVYELGYEISYRPSWVKIPLRGIVEVIREIEKLQEPTVRISRLGG